MQHGHPWFWTYLNLYNIPFYPQKPGKYFATQIWNRWGILVVMISNSVQYTRSKALLCTNCLLWRKDISSLCLVFFLIPSANKSVIFILSILYTVKLRERPGVIGSLFLTLRCNSDLELFLYSTFILDRRGRTYSKQLYSWCPYTCENLMFIWILLQTTHVLCSNIPEG